jgi:uncharacterized LabA/DUF88 family protein
MTLSIIRNKNFIIKKKILNYFKIRKKNDLTFKFRIKILINTLFKENLSKGICIFITLNKIQRERQYLYQYAIFTKKSGNP